MAAFALSLPGWKPTAIPNILAIAATDKVVEARLRTQPHLETPQFAGAGL
jgi:hypothetical protein